MSAPPPRPGDLLRSALAAARWRNLGALVCIAGHQAGEALVPVLVGYAIDRALIPGDLDQLLWWVLALAADFALLSLSYLCHARLAERASADAALGLRMRMARHLLDARRRTSTGSVGGTADVVAQDVTEVCFVNIAGFALAAGLTGLGVSAVAMFGVDVRLGLLVLAGTVPLGLTMRFLGGPLERRLWNERMQAAAAAEVAADLLRGLRALTGLGAQANAARRFGRVSAAALDGSLRSARFGALFGATTVLGTGLFVAVVAVAAGRLAIDGEISIGALVAALGLAQYLAGPLSQLSVATAIHAEVRASAVRVCTILAEEPIPFGDHRLDDRSVPRLAVDLAPGVRLKVAPGRLTGLVTDSHTAGHLLAALRGTTAAGTVDGVPVRDLDPDELRRSLVVPPHAAAIFDQSVEENVAAGPSTDPSRYVTLAALHDAVAALPGGLADTVGEGGHRLSGGERQRLALARALATEAPALVLDQPTSSVDTVTEARIADAVARHRAGRTTVVVTTSPAWLALCDDVVLVDAGASPPRVRHATHRVLLDDAGYRQTVRG